MRILEQQQVDKVKPMKRGFMPASRCIAVVLFALIQSGVGAHEIRIGGTGGALGTMKLLAESFNKANGGSARITLVPNLGSFGGIRALQGGAIEVALIGRPLRPDEQAAGLVAHEYGRSPFVLVTSRRDVANLPAAAFADMLSGRTPTWPDGQTVRLVMRPKTDSDTAHLVSMSQEIAQALAIAHTRPGMIVAITDQEAVDEAERLPGSLATSTLALVVSEGRRVNVVAFNGIKPSVKALADNVYPYAKSFAMITRATMSTETRKFIEFVKSREGRAILEANGHLVPAS
jgi:phosphate transport system substrate-binding protein